MTHPLWRPYDPPSAAELAAAYVTGREPTGSARVEIVPYDPSWPAVFDSIAERVRLALGGRAIALEHVGSTAVPGLAAKPIIDVDLLVADSADEEAYVPPLELAGFELVIREPQWEQHRCFRLGAPRCNLHVFSVGAIEAQRHVLFRERLRTDAGDRDAYAALKAQLASVGFTSVGAYNNAKAGLIYDIYERAFAADPAYDHHPRPRPAG